MRRTILGRSLAVVTLVGWLVTPALAQETKTARGNVTAVAGDSITVKAGDRAEIGFGAQSKTITVSEPAESQDGNRSSLLGIFGFLLLLGGAGLGYYAYRSGQPKSKLKGSPLTKR